MRLFQIDGEFLVEEPLTREFDDEFKVAIYGFSKMYVKKVIEGRLAIDFEITPSGWCQGNIDAVIVALKNIRHLTD